MSNNPKYTAYLRGRGRGRHSSGSSSSQFPTESAAHIPTGSAAYIPTGSTTHIPIGSAAQIPMGSETQPPSPPHTAGSGPFVMGIADFLSQPGRELLPVLHPVDPPGSWFKHSGNGISKSINKMLIALVKRPYKTFSTMPYAEQQIWFHQFAQEFNWDPAITEVVRKCFFRKAARAYSRKMNEWKTKWMMDEVPKEFVDDPVLWRNFIQYWSTPEAKSVSVTNSANRNSDRGGKGKATHNLGATSKASRAIQLYEKNGVEPTALDCLRDAHTNRSTGLIDDPFAREIIETVSLRTEEYLLSQESVDGPPCTEVPPEKINEFVYEAIPSRKGRRYGIPEDDSTSSGSFCLGVSALKAQLDTRNEELSTLKTEFGALKAHQQATDETLRQLQQQMMEFARNNPTPSFQSQF